jgi:hypothetical protein
MSLPWTEDRQSYLKSLSVEIARGVLALLSADDIARIVNNRQYQHDYIGDYLSYISTLDEAIHWARVEKSFDSPEGFLIYDGEEHISAMLSQQIPMSLSERLLESLSDEFDDQIRAADYGYPLDTVTSRDPLSNRIYGRQRGQAPGFAHLRPIIDHGRTCRTDDFLAGGLQGRRAQVAAGDKRRFWLIALRSKHCGDEPTHDRMVVHLGISGRDSRVHQVHEGAACLPQRRNVCS